MIRNIFIIAIGFIGWVMLAVPPIGFAASERGRCNADPEMMKALQWFINDTEGYVTNMDEFNANVDRARMALANARGKS